jgi:hypothetical protein
MDDPQTLCRRHKQMDILDPQRWMGRMRQALSSRGIAEWVC